jgi:chloramphenicol 3-O-phosphotransferase
VIIFLNGTSSSGKTTIARELLDVLDELYFHVPVDAFRAMRVHAHGIYDLEFDTSVTAARDCAALVRDFLPGRPAPTAFARLKVGETS